MNSGSDRDKSGARQPEFDRTVIRASGPAADSSAQAQGNSPVRVKEEGERNPARFPVLAYASLALGFLVVGGGIGGLVHLINSGAISFSAPSPADGEAGRTGTAETIDSEAPSHDLDRQSPTQSTADFQSVDNAENDPIGDDEIDVPADPFYDMAVSPVIPLAGDPVLLSSAAAGNRIDLSERSIPEKNVSGDVTSIPGSTAFVLDSEMLNLDGELVIRAPGSEADFQFGNFGGGEDEERLDVEEEQPTSGSSKSKLPTFLKPPTDTLNLFLTERPIGQGPNRLEIRTELSSAVSIEQFLKESGFDEDASRPFLKFVKEELEKSDFVAGDKIAIRGVRLPNKLGRVGDYYRPVQASFYSEEGYVGTAAFAPQSGEENYVQGADPWFGISIGQDKIANDKSGDGEKKHRLIDGLYATAIRNAVPASIVGEAIAYLAPTTDLKRAVEPGERFTLIFTDKSRDEKRGAGKVLFAGVRKGDDWSVRCYVLKAPGNRGFACVSEGGKVSLSGAMLVPVKGVLTSKFGMRFHPIKKTERLHAGVDWAAPTGSPIRAAFSGKVSYRDVRGGYGNFIELTHKGGITSRYAHMHEYADGIEVGSVVQAGDLIGYVGTTGLSTGPHLHFEIRQRGEPTDPLAFEMETGTDAPKSVAGKDLQDYRGTISEILTVH
ncbi:M23 family metallopeptidase [Roseibium sp. SCP14]|uniref:M23 family metallopeptidase n=1 Tax=Roseibium sp. SCP14 TaxID=3141375 RepID=UPI00333C96E0